MEGGRGQVVIKVVINAHVGWGRSWHGLTGACAARGGVQFCTKPLLSTTQAGTTLINEYHCIDLVLGDVLV